MRILRKQIRPTAGAVVLGCLSACLAAAPATRPTTRPASDSSLASSAARPAIDAAFQLTGADGVARKPIAIARADHARAVVFLFIAVDCPISNGYAPEFTRICAKYGQASSGGKAKAPVGVDFYLVHADPDTKPADAAKHAADFGYTCPALMDPHGQLASRLGATATPEAFVLSPAGVVLYQGRIDDQYVDFGRRREQPTTHDLRSALDSVVAGKPIAVSKTRAIGCPI